MKSRTYRKSNLKIRKKNQIINKEPVKDYGSINIRYKSNLDEFISYIDSVGEIKFKISGK